MNINSKDYQVHPETLRGQGLPDGLIDVKTDG